MKEELQKLIDSRKLDEAFKLFKDYFIKDQSSVDSGQIFTSLFEAYIDSMNSINKEEEVTLEEIQAVLTEIQMADQNGAKSEALLKLKQEF